MRLLVIDNGSSFIDRLRAALAAHETEVLPAAEADEDVLRADGFDAVVLSGGHGLAVMGNDLAYGAQLACIREGRVPVLGVCLGFELIAHAFGARLVRRPMLIRGDRAVTPRRVHPLFASQAPFAARQAHRWCVPELSPPLIALATSDDGVEILTHESRAIYGFQFHPEASAGAGRDVLGRALELMQK